MNTLEKTLDRDEAIVLIRAALKRRSGKTWSVTGGRGTAWGWITVEAPPARRTWGHRLKAGAVNDYPESWEGYDTGKPGGSMTPTEAAELGALFGFGSAHSQGISIPASHAHRAEYVERAEGRKIGSESTPAYWD